MSDEQEPTTQPTAPAESSPEKPQEHPQEAAETPATAPDEPAAPEVEETPEGRFVSVDEAAEHLGLSARTVRRRINAGELKAQRAEHSHAWLVWIEGLAAEPEPGHHQNGDASEAKETKEEQPAEQGSGAAGESALATLPITTETIHALTDLVADLTARNEALSMELGASRERIRQLEGQLQALPVGEVPAAVKPWWKRLLGIE